GVDRVHAPRQRVELDLDDRQRPRLGAVAQDRDRELAARQILLDQRRLAVAFEQPGYALAHLLARLHQRLVADPDARTFVERLDHERIVQAVEREVALRDDAKARRGQPVIGEDLFRARLVQTDVEGEAIRSRVRDAEAT